MANPVFSLKNIRGENVPVVFWEALATGDTVGEFGVTGTAAVAGSVQITGTFGGATVKLQASNDGTNFVDMKDVYGVTISTTTAALFEFSTSAVYVRPAISGGTGDDVDVTVCLRG